TFTIAKQITNMPICSTVFATGTGPGPCCNITVTNFATACCISNCVQITALCPPNPTSPGEVLVINGTVRNCGITLLSNVVAVVAHPHRASSSTTSSNLLPPGQSPNSPSSSPVPLNSPSCTVTSSLTVRSRSAPDASIVPDMTSITCPINNSA